MSQIGDGQRGLIKSCIRSANNCMYSNLDHVLEYLADAEKFGNGQDISELTIPVYTSLAGLLYEKIKKTDYERTEIMKVMNRIPDRSILNNLEEQYNFVMSKIR